MKKKIIKARYFLTNVTLMILYTIIFNHVQAKPNLNTEAEVTDYINKITDFNSIAGINYSFKRVDIIEDNTPFLHEKVKGRKNVWLVEMNNFNLKIKTEDPNFKDRYNRNFAILIDPYNGELLRISSKYDGNDPNVGKARKAEKVEKEFQDNIKYLGFPDTLPNNSFIDALNIVHKFGIGMPYNAKEIDAQYVWYSDEFRTNGEPQRVWIIDLRGIPPIAPPLSNDAIGIRAVNHIRYVINAETGIILQVGNMPSPEFDVNSDSIL